MRKEHPFLPIYNENSEVLILGTMPSVVSTKQGFYYMHPQNRFWKVLSNLYHEDAYQMSIQQKEEFILRHHLALYDVIFSCQIQNSSDASITNPVCTNLKVLIKKMPKLNKIVLNGKTAFQIFVKQYPELKKLAINLPSTSSANARVSLDDLTELWRTALHV